MPSDNSGRSLGMHLAFVKGVGNAGLPGVNKAPKGQTTLKPLVDAHDMFADSPGDLVFFEAASTLVNAKGKLVTKWF